MARLALVHGPDVFRAPELLRADSSEPLPRGQLIELAGAPDAARTTAATQILLESQREGDPVAWIQPRGGELYPPDLATAGLDLEGLLVVHVPESASPGGIPRATELLLRTGAFGAIAVDLDHSRLPRGLAWLGRLGALAREHDCRCVFLTPPATSSLGALLGLRLLARRARLQPGSFLVRTEVLKDKRGHRPSLPGLRRWRGPEGFG